ncbi:MAG TPA: NYN domain-containing protein [Gemmatimonadales bacterium]|nr:NYN domain-containing protein [Gemmatimonadales bacterium]
MPVHVHHAPHAALLIDFDNVTLGIRSDLTKELRTLLNSDIIKGKVAVQRAYADWRRYPQYIVPLSESSIDLIFAPAFGTNKKNATDIRLAVDATELVFTRPEIGTFILLSGDSDFSSLVIKLKEYGKYVIGVGIRESASDLLIQNCDEYYSYSDLAGLTKEPDTPSAQRDPWELVGEAVALMSRNGDVMRSDRLKQVMQQIDPNFDEKNAGFNRFSKFVTEAGAKGLLRVTKQDNGQFEVAPVSPATLPLAKGASPAREAASERGGENGKSRRGRGRGRGRGSAAVRQSGGAAVRQSGSVAEGRETEAPGGTLALAAAFQLMARALSELPAPVGGEILRARMAALHGREDPLLETARFSRLLRQANDAEVADVRKVGEDSYEITPHRAVSGMPVATTLASRPPVEPATEDGVSPAAPVSPGPARAAALRFRRGSRSMLRPAELPLVGVVHVDEPIQPEKTAKPNARRGKASAPPAEAALAAPTKRGRSRKKSA